MDDEAIASFLEREVPGLIAVYRFGSSARGDDRPDSDVDLALLAREPLSNRRRWDLQLRLEESLRRLVDLVDLHEAPTVLRMQVISTGIPLVVLDEDERTRFEDLTFSMYARLNEERRDILEQIRRDGTVHGR